MDVQLAKLCWNIAKRSPATGPPAGIGSARRWRAMKKVEEDWLETRKGAESTQVMKLVKMPPKVETKELR